MPATRLRALGRALQLGGEILVGAERGLRAVPRSAIRVCLRIGRLRQRDGGPPACRQAARRDRSPSARAGDETGPAPRARSSRPPPPAQPLRRPVPTSPAARISSAGSPAGSAAARSKNRCVCFGIARTRPRKLCSRRAESGCVELTRNPPASSAADSPRGSSSNAKGLPRVSATIRSITRSSTRPAIAEPSTPRASSSFRPSTMSSGSPAKVCSSAGSRTANTRATDSAMSLRATNASVRAEA